MTLSDFTQAHLTEDDDYPLTFCRLTDYAEARALLEHPEDFEQEEEED